MPALLLVACSALFEDAQQCSTDADCTQFGAMCSDGICTRKTAGGGGDRNETGPTPNDPIEASTDGPVAPDPCVATNKPVVELAGDVTADQTLSCTSEYVLKTKMLVRRGATLTIDAGVLIRADTATMLAVQPGGRVVVNGTKDKPVVMTSSSATPKPGDWMGFYVIGEAPSTGSNYFIDPDLNYAGGADVDSNSGSISYLRIEYGVYGLALGAVGRGTKIDSVMVRGTSDNCFTVFGGTVDLKHLICQFPGDEMFEGNDTWQGRLQYFYGSQTPSGDEHHGILLDHSTATMSNVTLCGTNLGQSYGLVVRNSSTIDLANMIVTGWFGGVDTRGPTTLASTEIAYSTFFGNAGNPAYAEGSSADPNSNYYDDDNGFNEIAWFENPSRVDMEDDPALVACTDPAAPKPYPLAPIAGRAPANDGFFDAAAAYRGAFSDPNDDWANGAWAKFGAP